VISKIEDVMRLASKRPWMNLRREQATLFITGFVAMLPLWAGAIPFGIAYGGAAREAGLSPLQTQLMSLTVFSAAGQISAVSMIAAGAGVFTVLISILLLNLQLFLLATVISRQLQLGWLRRILTASLLTDASFAIATSKGQLTFPTLLGAGMSMYLGWNIGTAFGVLLDRAIPDPRALAFDLIVPLTFLAVLVPLIRTRIDLIVAASSGLLTLVLVTGLPAGVTVLVAALLACVVGVLLSPDRQPDTRTPRRDDMGQERGP
jgi:predicted branched-subunit amino acid permease